MRLTVHIGTTKTGSTSIQRFLDQNREQIRSQGILVPRSLGKAAHQSVAVSSLPFGKSPDLARKVSVSDLHSYNAFREATVANFHAEIADAPDCQEVVITSEHLHSRLTSTDHVKSFQTLFCKTFDEVRIVAYVRPQLDHAASLYSTMIRHGYAHPMRRFVKSRMHNPSALLYFDLHSLISRWTDIFGRQNIIVRPYKGCLQKGGILPDFCRLLDLDSNVGDWANEPRLNTSINMDGQELLLLINKFGALDHTQLRQVVRWVERNCSGRGAEPPLGLAQEFQALFAEGNTWVVNEFFPGHPEYLEPQLPDAE